MAQIDRNNKSDVLKQIGRTEEKIAQHNRKMAKIDNEIDNWPRRKEHLIKMKGELSNKISNHRIYINQLENDLNKL